MSDRELMQQALEAAPLSDYSKADGDFYKWWYSHMQNDLMQPPLNEVGYRVARYIWDAALRERLAQQEQEPVKFNCTVVDDAHPEGVPLSQWGQQQKQKPFCYHDGRNIVGKEYAHHCDVFPLYTEQQPEQEPLTDEEFISMVDSTGLVVDPELAFEIKALVEAAPPQRKPLVWLSEEEERQIKDHCTTVACVLRAVKAKLKEKNK